MADEALERAIAASLGEDAPAAAPPAAAPPAAAPPAVAMDDDRDEMLARALACAPNGPCCPASGPRAL